MKYILSLLMISSSLIASPIYDEAALFSELIEISKKNLDEQQELYKLIVDFKKNREAFIANPESKKLAQVLVRSAKKLAKTLEKSSFCHLLSEEFQTEVKFFAEASKK